MKCAEGSPPPSCPAEEKPSNLKDTPAGFGKPPEGAKRCRRLAVSVCTLLQILLVVVAADFASSATERRGTAFDDATSVVVQVPEEVSKGRHGDNHPPRYEFLDSTHRRISSRRENSGVFQFEESGDWKVDYSRTREQNTGRNYGDTEDRNEFWKLFSSIGIPKPVTDICETDENKEIVPKTLTKNYPESSPLKRALRTYQEDGSLESSRDKILVRPSRMIESRRSSLFQDRPPGRIVRDSAHYGGQDYISRIGRRIIRGSRIKRKIEVSSVNVVEGEEAALPCDLRSPSPGDTVQIILWIKEGLHTPLYSYDYRELLRGRPRETKPDANSTLSRKTNFRTDRSPAALIIEDADAEDSGVYRCRVDFLHSPTLNYRVNLTVFVPPSEVRISWPAENSTLIQAKGNEAGPFHEFSRPILICSNDNGWPPPSVIWYEGSQVLDESYTYHGERGTVENALAFDPLTRDDLGRNLTCVVSNTNKTRPATKSVTISLKLRIMGVRVNSLGTLWAGEQARAECQIWGSRPPPTVLWWRGSQLLLPTETKHLDAEQNVTLSFLDFYPNAVDDGTMLICQATNEMLPDQAVQDSTILAVNFKPVVDVNLGRSLDPDKIKEGDDVYFECSVASKPPAVNVIWKHNGAMLRPRSGLILSNVSLVVQGVTRAHGGNYTCHATNVRGTSSSKPLHLDVKYTPVCATDQKQQTHSVGKEENAEISCKVDANPREVTFRWTFNNTAEAIDVPQGRFGVVGTESRVNYTPMNELDYGTLLCWANNSIGVQQFPCVFQIVAAGKPDPPHNCRVFDVTISSLQVNCLPGNDGGLAQTFMLQVYKVGSTVPVEEVTHSFPSFSVRSLTPATSYRIALASLNDKGASEMIELDAYTLKVMESLEETSAEPTRDRDRGPGIPLAVLIGAVVVFVPVVVASIILVWLKVRRSAGPPDEGSRNVIGCDSGSEVDANTHSSHSRDPNASTDFAALSDITIPEGASPDVVLISDAPSWTGHMADISTISASPYMAAGGEKRCHSLTRATSSVKPARTSAPSLEGGTQYKQLINQEHSYNYPDSSSNPHPPGNIVSEVPYYVESNKLQQVKRTPTKSPAPQRYESNHLQFASTGDLNDPKRCSQAAADKGKEGCKGCLCGQSIGQGPGQSFPHLLPAHQEPLSKPFTGSSHCSVHQCHEDSFGKQEGRVVRTVARNGSIKSFAQCGSTLPRQLSASNQSFRKSVDDMSQSPGMLLPAGTCQNKPVYQTASLSRSKREQRSMEAVDTHSSQHSLEWPWKHKRESAV
ncbi:neural cell adhesion molecule 1-like isoform X2 [Palaemon carinicauda]|uniref:neural cell adhesion molecule 1-like isoform X2 n=1 Tax=Palaemon carinicauda TaxID=392227 RepID=UPI0035B67E71